MRSSEALSFLDRCSASTDLRATVDDFLTVIAGFGFDACAAGAWTGAAANRAHRFYFNNWPADWLAIYQEQDLFRTDPLIYETQRRMSPFLWSEAEKSRSFVIEGPNVVQIGRAYGWVEGFVVPVHGPASYQGLVSMASLKPVSLSNADLSLLRAMALAIHDRCHDEQGFGQTSHPTPDLTRREIDCMQWVAAGKTDSEIGQILGISAATAHFHVERVKKKLNVNSRTEAVALLVLAGSV